MKVLHVPYHYFPEAVGGTEVYVSSLVARLRKRGVEVEIAAPGAQIIEYEHEGICVRRFTAMVNPDLAVLYGPGDPEAARQFGDILDHSHPDVVHLHSYTPAVSLLAVREIKRRQIPVVYTKHIPGPTCSRGTLLYLGKEACDGTWNLNRCLRCCLESHGLPKVLAQAMTILPTCSKEIVNIVGISGRAATALRAKELLRLQKQSADQFLREVDHIVVVSHWLLDLLEKRGVPRQKIKLSPHGATQSREANVAAYPKPEGSPLRIVFVGRLNPQKGLHILLAALARVPALDVKLDIFGIKQEESSDLNKIFEAAAQDRRIAFRSPVPNPDIVTELRNYDVMAIPSLWMETGPLVVYDAFQAGIPVIGSNRGGIAELVKHNQDGLLVEAGNIDAWTEVIERLAGDASLLKRLRAGVRRPRSMDSVADEMLILYEMLVAPTKAEALQVF